MIDSREHDSSLQCILLPDVSMSLPASLAKNNVVCWCKTLYSLISRVAPPTNGHIEGFRDSNAELTENRS